MASDRMYVALADSLHILVFDLAGEPLAPLRGKSAPAASTAADLDAEAEREVAMTGEKFRKRIESEYRGMPRPASLPATQDLVDDAHQNLCVQHFPRAASRTVQWTVFAPGGRVVAEVALPTAFELYEAGCDDALGRYIDPDETIPEVRLYRLTRR